MGTIKTTNIEPIADNGTVTLGSSGDTFALASGVTQTIANNTPAFHAYQNGNLSIANATFQVVAFNTEYFDSNSAYNTSDGKFTVPSGEAGKYLFAFSFKRGNWHSNRFIATFAKNNNDTAYFEDSASGSTNYGSATGSIIMDLAVGDYITIKCYQDSGSAQNITGSTNQGSNIFSGFKLT